MGGGDNGSFGVAVPVCLAAYLEPTIAAALVAEPYDAKRLVCLVACEVEVAAALDQPLLQLEARLFIADCL